MRIFTDPWHRDRIRDTIVAFLLGAIAVLIIWAMLDNQIEIARMIHQFETEVNLNGRR